MSTTRPQNGGGDLDALFRSTGYVAMLRCGREHVSALVNSLIQRIATSDAPYVTLCRRQHPNQISKWGAVYRKRERDRLNLRLAGDNALKPFISRSGTFRLFA